jgi:ABC-2 type transport system permease protein
LLRLFARTELQFAMEYRANLVLDLFEELIIVLTSFAAVKVLYSQTSSINGWTEAQMIELLGVYYIVQGAQAIFFEASFERFMEHVRMGTLDFILIKPVDSQFVVSTRHVQIPQLGQAALGFFVLGIGINEAGGSIGPLDALAFAITMACGLLLVYGLLLMLSTLSFWFVRVENLLAIYWSFIDAGRFPVDIYPGWLRFTLSTVVPIGVAVTVPAQAVSGRLDAIGLVGMIAGTVVVLWFANWFWRRGLRSYTGASA